MTISVQKISLPKLEEQTEKFPLLNENYLGIVGDLEVECQVQLGTLLTTIDGLRQLTSGQILALNQKTNEPIDILLNNQVIARGELMSCDDYFALLITEVLSC